MSTPFDLTGKHILVTGASSGIGRQTAVSVSKMGGSLIISGRNEERLQQTYQMLEGAGHQQFQADLTDENKIKELVATVGALDGMVHCAGILRPYPVKFITQKQIDEMMSVNLYSAIHLSAQLVHKKKFVQGASLIYISSVSGKEKPYYGGALYAASKAGLEAFCRVLALELAPRGIRANCISPAIVKTPIFDEFIGGIASQENVDAYSKQYPFGFGEPEDVANAAIYLLSGGSRWVTGATIVLDGGLTLT
ncbi:MAG: SDR family oxidoreductase [Bacteroidota bacterium]